ncbi:hypothetical protein [Streptomyces prunicolor]|uniref:hypothetical protein n=1 Tax=Streptomyces prunicolor TaxID=67348 RepID=UPI00037237F0|nr:hypothetical protein [Streptomyces prunicolor]
MNEPLTPTQQSIVDFARRDLATARSSDLGSIEAASLILLVERMRHRLDSVLEVIDEVAAGIGSA